MALAETLRSSQPASSSAAEAAAASFLRGPRRHVLLLLCVSRHVVHFAFNLLFSLQQQHRLPQTALTCLDSASQHAFSRLQIACALLPVEQAEAQAQDLGVTQRPGTAKAVWQRAKLQLLTLLLRAGQHVLMCDVDMYWQVCASLSHVVRHRPRLSILLLACSQHDLVPLLLQPPFPGGAVADVIGARAFSRQHNASARHGMAVALAAGVRGADRNT